MALLDNIEDADDCSCNTTIAANWGFFRS